MTKQGWIKIGIYSVGALALSGATAFTINQIRKKRFSSAHKGVGTKESDLIGKTVELGSNGFANIRSTPEIPNSGLDLKDVRWYDVLSLGASYAGRQAYDYTTSYSGSNLVTVIRTNPVGTITNVVKGKDGWNWYKISYKGGEASDGTLGSAILAASGTQRTGYVREDAVNVKF